MSILPSVSVYNFRYPTTEELKAYTTQLEDLRQEANKVAVLRDTFSLLRIKKEGKCDVN